MERNRLNSPLLDLLFSYHKRTKVSTHEQDLTLAKASLHHIAFVLDRHIVEAKRMLAYASAVGNKSAVVFLLDRGFDAYHFKWALNRAARFGHKEVAELLLDRNANVDTEVKSKALGADASFGQKEVAMLLLDRGAKLEYGFNDALCRACQDGFKDVVSLFLDRGADIHAQVESALLLAAMNGHKEVVELFLDRGADIHAQNDDALRLAFWSRRQEVVRLLLDRGANTHM